MTAAVRNLYIEQGATFSLGFTWHREGPVNSEGEPTPGDPYDLTGCTARMQVRKKQGDVPLVTATSLEEGDGAGRIHLGGVTGRIEVTLTDEDTDLLTSRAALYDLEVEWPLELSGPNAIRPRVDRLLQGAVTVDPNITQVDNEDPVVT